MPRSASIGTRFESVRLVQVSVHETFGREGEWPRHRRDQVRRAEIPAVRPLRGSRQIRGLSFDRAFRYPPLKSRQLVLAQAAFGLEASIIRFGRPRWHDALGRHLGDLRRPFFYIRIAQQTERRSLVRPMTRRATLENNGGNVPIERCRFELRRRRCLSGGGGLDTTGPEQRDSECDCGSFRPRGHFIAKFQAGIHNSCPPVR